MTAAATTLDVRRAADRFTTRIGWLDSKHFFSFGLPMKLSSPAVQGSSWSPLRS